MEQTLEQQIAELVVTHGINTVRAVLVGVAWDCALIAAAKSTEQIERKWVSIAMLLNDDNLIDLCRSV